MKTTFKILTIFILFSILFISTVNAASILMNLEDYTQNIQNTVQDENNLDDTNITENQLDNNSTNDQTNIVNEPESEDEDDSTRVTYSAASNDGEFLTTENILSIIIIVIGILLVFFAVAILIRIK